MRRNDWNPPLARAMPLVVPGGMIPCPKLGVAPVLLVPAPQAARVPSDFSARLL